MGPTRSCIQITKYHDQPKLKGDAHCSKLSIPQHDPFLFWSEAKFCILSQLSEPQKYLNRRDLRAFMYDLALFPISISRWSSKIRGKANYAMFKESV